MSWRLKASPEDFVVDEVPLFEPSGEGGHTYVHVEKRLRTTEQVARWLARAAGVSPRDVGYAGQKDRVAVARQWFSVPGLSQDVAHVCSRTRECAFSTRSPTVTSCARARCAETVSRSA